jgi:hypothetical protein
MYKHSINPTTMHPERNINSNCKVTLTKVLVGGFPWLAFSVDCRKHESSMQLEGVIAGLSEKLVPAVRM